MTSSLIRIAALFVLFLSITHAQSMDTTITSINFQVTTSSPGGNYSPRNIGAIWIEDANGFFVKTLKVWANNRRQYLYTWNNRSGGNTVDGVTGATYSSHGTRSATWDFTDVSGHTVPAGDYSLRVELTDRHSQGPLYAFTFPYLGATETILPPDQSNFHTMSLSYNLDITVGLETGWRQQPGQLLLFENSPNPFNPSTQITYALNEATHARVAIFDVQGREIRELVNREQPAGQYSLMWDGLTRERQFAQAGIYICRLTTAEQSHSIKMVLLK